MDKYVYKCPFRPAGEAVCQLEYSSEEGLRQHLRITHLHSSEERQDIVLQSHDDWKVKIKNG